VREAINRGKDDSYSLTMGGMGLAFLAQTTAEVEEGVAFIDQALLLNPNFARAWHLSGWARVWLGEPEIAIEHLARAMRLSPLDTGFHGMEAGTAWAHLRAGRYGEATVWAEKALRGEPSHKLDALGVLSIANSLAGDLDKAQAAMKRLLEIAPGQRISNYFRPFTTPERRALITNALRKAGMPD
jgi:tetratricopeptide (TPR) repeat protein